MFALALGALAITSVPQFTSDVSAQPNVGSAPTRCCRISPIWPIVLGRAVVGVRTTARAGAGQSALPFPDIDENDPMFEFFRRFFPNPPQQPQPRQGPQQPAPRRDVPRGLGSGFILSPDGYVMTNAHVVRGADDITVTTSDRREFKAKVIGADTRTDVALLKVEATGLPAVRMGDPNKLRVGEWVDRDRIAVRAREHGHRRHRQREVARYRRFSAVHSDRRCGQSGQLRRTADQHARRSGRHQLADLHYVGRLQRYLVRDTDR